MNTNDATSVCVNVSEAIIKEHNDKRNIWYYHTEEVEAPEFILQSRSSRAADDVYFLDQEIVDQDLGSQVAGEAEDDGGLA